MSGGSVSNTFFTPSDPQLHGEYVIILADGTAVTSGRSYRRQIQLVFGLD